MANLLCTDTELQTVADAIRSKGNTSAALGFPTGMKNAIDALNVGTGLSPAASAADIRSGKKAVVDRTTITGSMTEKAAATYTPTESAQEIAAGQYLAGKQTISAISSTYVGSGVTKKAAATYNTSTSDQSVAANQYLTGAQTIKAVTTSNIDAANIKKGVTVKVGDANSAGRIKNVTGTYTSDATAAAGDIRSGKTAYVNGSKLTGSMTEKAAATYNTSTSDQSISASQYLTGAQTIKAVTTENISAGNIKSGVAIKVGDANSPGRIKNITGTYGPATQDYYVYLLTGTTIVGTNTTYVVFRFTDTNTSGAVTAHPPLAISKIKSNSFVTGDLMIVSMQVAANGEEVTLGLENNTAQSIWLPEGYYGLYTGVYMA